jgi:hypothetical protein
MKKEIDQIKQDIIKEESNKNRNQQRLAVLYSNLERYKHIQRNLQHKKYWAEA